MVSAAGIEPRASSRLVRATETVRFRLPASDRRIWWPGTELNHSPCSVISKLLILWSARSACTSRIANLMCFCVRSRILTTVNSSSSGRSISAARDFRSVGTTVTDFFNTQACLQQLLRMTRGSCWNESPHEAKLEGYRRRELVCELTDLRSSPHYV